MTNFTFSKQKI